MSRSTSTNTSTTFGYDLDENDTDILAWDRAVQHRRKAEKPKSVSPPVPVIKQEVDLMLPLHQKQKPRILYMQK